MADSWEEHSGGDDGKLNPSAASFSFNPSVTSFVPSGVIPASSNDDITDSMAKVTIASPPQPIKEQEEEKKQEEEEEKKKKQEEEEEKRKQEEEEKKRKQEEEKQQQEEQEEEEDISKRQEIIKKVLEDLNAEDPREHMNVVFIGHVDAGKSTTAGQILFLTGGVDDRTIEKYEREAKEKNRESWYMAYIMDTNEEERAKGKTVEVGRAHFETKKKRYTILDAPGHKSFVPNMISGASQADIGVLVISARKGEFETGFERGGQTREHAQLAKTLGVSKLVVAINKMDDPSVVESGDAWSQARFDDIVAKLSPFLRGCGYNPKKDLIFIPISGLMGHNMKDSVDKSICPWYNGKPFFDILDEIDPISRDPFAPFRMPIMDKYKDMGTVVMGKCESGVVAKGDKLTMMPNKVAVKVTTVWRDEIEVQAARPGENLRLRLSGIEEDEISAGFVLSDPFKRVPVVHQFEAQIAVLDLLEHKPILTGGYTAILHLHSVVEECEVIKLVAAIDPKTKEKKKTKFVKSGSICIARIAVEKPICVESFDTNPQLGRFTLRDEGRTIAIGKVTKIPKK
jgi:peptide chain release factor subunit 3